MEFMDARAIQKAYLVVHSAIGRVVAPLALDHPERFAGFVALADTPLLPPLPGVRRKAGSGKRCADLRIFIEDLNPRPKKISEPH